MQLPCPSRSDELIALFLRDFMVKRLMDGLQYSRYQVEACIA